MTDRPAARAAGSVRSRPGALRSTIETSGRELPRWAAMSAIVGWATRITSSAIVPPGVDKERQQGSY